jgi:hypothetical protein
MKNYKMIRKIKKFIIYDLDKQPIKRINTTYLELYTSVVMAIEYLLYAFTGNIKALIIAFGLAICLLTEINHRAVMKRLEKIKMENRESTRQIKRSLEPNK